MKGRKDKYTQTRLSEIREPETYDELLQRAERLMKTRGISEELAFRLAAKQCEEREHE